VVVSTCIMYSMYTMKKHIQSLLVIFFDGLNNKLSKFILQFSKT
jgi:hypothetical protein